jgi:accessory colonization factor AcfC
LTNLPGATDQPLAKLPDQGSGASLQYFSDHPARNALIAWEKWSLRTEPLN